MKNRITRLALAGGLSVAFLGVFTSQAQTSNGAPAASTTTAVAAPSLAATSGTTTVGASDTAAKLPYGVDDVLKLSKAQVSEEITLNYIRNSGIAYNLGPNEIVYLRGQGVSDRVVNAMLDERKRVVAEASVAVAASSAAPAPAADTSATVVPVYAAPQAEAQASPSTVYVIPNSQAGYAYYPYPYYGYAYYGYPYYRYPYYYRGPYGYGGYYCGPSVAVGFSFGGHGHGWHHH